MILRNGRAREQFALDATLEHKLSRLDGCIKGRNRVANLTLACYQCNHDRGCKQDFEQARLNKVARSCPPDSRARESWFAAWARDMERFDRF